MRLLLVLFAVGAAGAAGYLYGDEGELSAAVWVVAGAVVLALLLYVIVPEGSGSDSQRVSLRPASAPARAKVLLPGDAARLREQERILEGGGPVGLRLVDTGRNQIAVIKVLRNYLDIGLKEAKDLSDGAKRGHSPLVAAEIAVEVARAFLADLEKAGGVAELVEVGK